MTCDGGLHGGADLLERGGEQPVVAGVIGGELRGQGREVRGERAGVHAASGYQVIAALHAGGGAGQQTPLHFGGAGAQCVHDAEPMEINAAHGWGLSVAVIFTESLRGGTSMVTGASASGPGPRSIRAMR